MGDKRKLQGEIERCLKKVSEGVETFEDIWQKVHNATNSNQKEKYEADLKKEIKKLQRLRDQIKSWAASNEIKDKRILLENRKLIETQMERFKVVERETKTKAYSKEGLGLAAKVDPIQKEKDDISTWMRGSIDKLNLQIDQFELEVENITSSSKKRKIPTDRQERLDQLQTWLEKHRFHIRQLEMLMRMLDNSTIEVDQIKKIQDDLEYYLDYSQEPDFEENEFMYDELDIDESEVGPGHLATSPDDDVLTSLSDTPLSSSPVVSSSLPTSSNHSKDKSEDEKKTRTKSVDADQSSPRKGSGKSANSLSSSTSSTTASTSQNRPTITRVSSSPGASTTNTTAAAFGNLTQSSKNSLSKANSVPSVTTPHTIAQPPSGPAYAVAAGGQTHSSSQGSHPTSRVAAQPPAASQHMMSNSLSSSSSSMAQSTTSVQHTNTQQPRPDMNGPHQGGFSMSSIENSVDHITSSVANMSTNSTSFSHAAHSAPPAASTASSVPFISQPKPTSVVDSVAAATALTTSVTAPTKNSDMMGNGPVSPEDKQEDDSSSMSTLKIMAQKVIMSSGLENFQSDLISENRVYNSTSRSENQGQSMSPASSTPQYQETTIPPLLGVAPLGPVTLTKEQMLQQSVMESCYHHLPHPSDSERQRNYLPRNPCPTPIYHCQTMPLKMGNLEFFMRLSTETLFFIFYYQEGTKAQYLAAKALKRQSWRFHTKYMMWFQRHEEPKTITEEFEQGTYIYFDYEKWGQRKKEGFTFEYRYLEDREL
ncbi:CCR4-NOT transcription complex subunit 3-like [Diadema setosum]|uniref:CCR4-NOT transcription complex subunit 3-like n=1 Tax=Diadema setosum TaxID=31175 RepID=UPI003B3A8856